MKAPSQRKGREDNGPARTIDILPTIADTLGVRLSGPVDGRPLRLDTIPNGPVRVGAYGGGEVRLSFPDFLRRRDAAIQRRLRLFGSGDGFAGIFAAGPHRNLVGQRVARFVPASAAPFHADFDYRPEYGSFARAGKEAPAFVTGRLTGSVPDGETVAIAINGRIVAVTASYAYGKDVRFGAMVPVTAFQKGANTVQALAVSGSGPSTRLALAGSLKGEKAELVSRGGSLVVISSGGRKTTVAPGAAVGHIDGLTKLGETLTLTGWATDPAHHRAADRVLVFKDGHLIQAGPPSTPRLDVAAKYGVGVAEAGFMFNGIAPGRQGSAKLGDLRVVAIVDGHASELKAD